MNILKTVRVIALVLMLAQLASQESAQASPLRVPAAPKILQVVPVDGGLTVTASIPRSISPILNFEYSTDGGISWVAESPPVTTGTLPIHGLTNEVAYSIAVRATSAVGSGLASIVKTATPATVPDAPHIDLIKGTGMWFHVYFTAGRSDGHSPITQWQFDIDQTGRWQHWGKKSLSPQIVMMPWAKLGDSHVIRVRAVNAAGASDVSNTVTVTMIKSGLHIFQ